MMTASGLAKRLAQKAKDVCALLLPRGNQEDETWCADEEGKIFRIGLSGDQQGVWIDPENNKARDLLDLWCIKRNLSLSAARKQVCQYLGITTPQFSASTPLKLASFNENKLKLIEFNSPTFQYLTKEKKLSQQTLSAFRVGEKNEYLVYPSFVNDDLVQLKYCSLMQDSHQKRIYIEHPSQFVLFGWQAHSNHLREITIAQNEINAMSLHEYGIPALSLPFESGDDRQHQWIDLEFDRLSIFDKIYLSVGHDDQAKKLIDTIVDRLGRHRCYIVTLPEKDANTCLQNGISQAMIQHCFQEASTYDPAELRSAHDYLADVMNLFYPEEFCTQGYLAPWEKTREHVIFRPHELSVWTGINGHGKSQFLGQVLLGAMEQGARVCIASLEMKPSRLLMRLTRQYAACEQPTENTIVQVQNWFNQKLWLFDLVGTAKTDRLLEVFQYARQRYGIDVFLIDSLLKCSLAEDDYNAQKAFIEQLCDFKNEHACHVHVVAHPRKSGDEKTVPGKLDIKGTGSITDLADNCFTIWRNKEKARADEADCLWKCNKQRNGEWEDKFAFWFDPKSFQYLEYHHDQPKPMACGIE